MNIRSILVIFALAGVAAAPPVRWSAEPLPGITARSIGPATMGGRITAVAVVESRPAIQYIGTAGGGVWKTLDNGLTWTAVFDGRPHASIGSVAVAPSDPSVIWVGTGEANARNSVSWGNGVFVSRDAGKSWSHVGLTDTRHIGKIVVHPRDPNRAYVAALGQLWGPNRERGVFRTQDGGTTWEHVLALDSQTGCVDLAIDPDQPETLYTTAYRVRRDGFSGPNPGVQFGPLAGIYRSRDGGTNWKRLTRGLPTRPMGRIGLAVWRKDPRVVLAVVQTDRTDISRVPGQPPGNSRLVETGGIFRSLDRGETWIKINDLCPRPFYYGQIRIDPGDAQRLWVPGISLYFSRDGGRTFSANGARGVHVDHHDLWINPADTRHMILGGDGGLSYSRDRATTWQPVRNLPIGQFYGIAVDMRTPYRIYGGMQDNGTWGGPSRASHPAGIVNSEWRRLLGFDGFQCQVPPDDPGTLLAEGQYGRLNRIDLRTRRTIVIQPRKRADTPAYRFNWCAPLLLSAHDTKTLYFGGNYLFRSTDLGNTWRIISPDLTRGQPGPSAHTGHTLTAIAESPRQAELLYTGSDDGKVHVTRDQGRTWIDLSQRLPGVPATRWITRVECSPHATGTAWLSLSRHRQNDLAPYLFRTDDFGATWKSATANLPAEGPIHVLRADRRNPNLLYLGTEFGLFVSLNGGASWQPLGAGLPPVAVHDLVVHPRERELVVATHGRSLWIIDVAPLQELTAKVREAKVHLFDVRTMTMPQARPVEAVPSRTYAGSNPPTGVVVYYRLAEKQPSVSLQVLAAEGGVVAHLPAPAEPGLHAVEWKPDRPGEYSIRLEAAGEVIVKKARVEKGRIEMPE
jgi:photosystem II stability/assembly factor-like uncharacterized protein